MTLRHIAAIATLTLGLVAVCHAQTVTLPAGTPLPVQMSGNLPMRVGQPVEARLLYAVYVDNVVVLPERTVVTGTVVRLLPDRSRRTQARLNADFTPFHIPVVHFTEIQLPDGTAIPIEASDVSDGAPLVRLTARQAQKGGLVRSQLNGFLDKFHEQTSLVTAPGKTNRLLQMFYGELPYHPEQIVNGTEWTIEITAPIQLPESLPESATAPSVPSGPPHPPPENPQAKTWTIKAYLSERLDSHATKAGQPIHATVAEPVYNADHSIALPEGAIVDGVVTESKPARSFGRAGTLRFDFRSITLPGGDSRRVQSSLVEADSNTNADLSLSSENKVKPHPQDKIVIPVLMGILATSALDEDAGDSMLGKDLVSSNGLGMITRIVAATGGSPHFAVGVGAYGTAIAVYRRWLRHGRDVVFTKNTRIVLEATPRSNTVLKPARP